MKPAPKRLSFITADEEALIKYQIELVGVPSVVKSGLQRLCSHLESGRVLKDGNLFRNSVMGLIFTGETLVRRWAYKTISYIGKRRDAEALIGKLAQEPDAENVSWIVAAIFALSKDADIIGVCKEAGGATHDLVALASLLYGDRKPGTQDIATPQIDIDSADPLILKWCALLAGYDRAPSNLMHPRLENSALLGALNMHDVSEVAEYSVWALWKGNSFSISELAIPTSDLTTQPENVRRWINRLVTKSTDFLSRNLDLFDTLNDDESRKAREGLAIGIRDVHFPDLVPRVGRWFSAEADRDLRELLMEHMAANVAIDEHTIELLKEEYAAAGIEQGLRRRLRSAASNKSNLYVEFKRIDARTQMQSAAEPIFDGLIEGRGLDMSSKTTFNIAGNLNAQNVSGGDIVNIASKSIQSMQQSDPETAKTLEEIVHEVSNLDIDDHKKNAVYDCVNRVAETPSTDNKKKLFDILNDIASIVTISTAAGKLPALIAIVSAWL